MKRTAWMLLALAILAIPAFAADKKAVIKEEPKKVEVTPKPTEVATAAATPEAKKEEPKAKELEKVEGSHKSNALATLLAFIPGVAAHGSGHLYAGSYIKGAGLLVVEGASIWLGANTYESTRNDMDKVFNNKNSQIPTDMGQLYGRVGIMLVCTTAFIYTWFDDIAGASTAVDVYNKKSDKEAQTTFRLAPQPEGAVLVYQRTF